VIKQEIAPAGPLVRVFGTGTVRNLGELRIFQKDGTHVNLLQLRIFVCFSCPVEHDTVYRTGVLRGMAVSGGRSGCGCADIAVRSMRLGTGFEDCRSPSVSAIAKGKISARAGFLRDIAACAA
jgi:hypothetical protein